MAREDELIAQYSGITGESADKVWMLLLLPRIDLTDTPLHSPDSCLKHSTGI